MTMAWETKPHRVERWGLEGETPVSLQLLTPKRTTTVNIQFFSGNSSPIIAGRELRSWRRLALPDLEILILKVQRSAVHQHLSPAEWRTLDRMRARRAALLKESVS
jgi:hypothetical protein